MRTTSIRSRRTAVPAVLEYPRCPDCSGPTARASTTSRSSSTPSSPTTTPRSTAARSSAPDRDAPFVLDGVLYHVSDLDLEEHYTDTHGAPRSTSPPSGWSACGSARASAACQTGVHLRRSSSAAWSARVSDDADMPLMLNDKRDTAHAVRQRRHPSMRGDIRCTPSTPHRCRGAPTGAARRTSPGASPGPSPTRRTEGPSPYRFTFPTGPGFNPVRQLFRQTPPERRLVRRRDHVRDHRPGRHPDDRTQLLKLGMHPQVHGHHLRLRLIRHDCPPFTEENVPARDHRPVGTHTAPSNSRHRRSQDRQRAFPRDLTTEASRCLSLPRSTECPAGAASSVPQRERHRVRPRRDRRGTGPRTPQTTRPWPRPNSYPHRPRGRGPTTGNCLSSRPYRFTFPTGPGSFRDRRPVGTPRHTAPPRTADAGAQTVQETTSAPSPAPVVDPKRAVGRLVAPRWFFMKADCRPRASVRRVEIELSDATQERSRVRPSAKSVGTLIRFRNSCANHRRQRHAAADAVERIESTTGPRPPSPASAAPAQTMPERLPEPVPPPCSDGPS